jgi:hypothetical protein
MADSPATKLYRKYKKQIDQFVQEQYFDAGVVIPFGMVFCISDGPKKYDGAVCLFLNVATATSPDPSQPENSFGPGEAQKGLDAPLHLFEYTLKTLREAKEKRLAGQKYVRGAVEEKNYEPIADLDDDRAKDIKKEIGI